MMHLPSLTFSPKLILPACFLHFRNIVGLCIANAVGAIKTILVSVWAPTRLVDAGTNGYINNLNQRQ